MAKLTVLIGPPASGKSTYVKNKSNVVSSDEIRYDLQESECGNRYQYNPSLNKQVFKKFYEKLEESLLKGKDVIADATNINVKDRRGYFMLANKLKKAGVNVEVHGVLFLKDVTSLIEHDAKRGVRSVGEQAIINMLKRFKAPNPNIEMWDKLTVVNSVSHENMDAMWELMTGFDQETKWHDLTLDNHTYEVMGKMPTARLKEIALFHDVGKLYTKTYKDDGQAQYLGHASVSSYIYLCEVKELTKVNLQNAIIIERHMTDLNTWNKVKAIKEMGKEPYYMLHILEAADKPNVPNPIDLDKVAIDYEKEYYEFYKEENWNVIRKVCYCKS